MRKKEFLFFHHSDMRHIQLRCASLASCHFNHTSVYSKRKKGKSIILSHKAQAIWALILESKFSLQHTELRHHKFAFLFPICLFFAFLSHMYIHQSLNTNPSKIKLHTRSTSHHKCTSSSLHSRPTIVFHSHPNNICLDFRRSHCFCNVPFGIYFCLFD